MIHSNFNLQPEILENDIVKLIPLQESHFKELFSIASDPLLWELHPMKERYKKENFTPFFEQAIQFKSSFLIIDKSENEVMGTTRFYDYDAEKSSVAIGYTFIARKFWGGKYNTAVKNLMIEYAFANVDTILFHVGSENIRSQKAVLKLGASKINELMFPLNGLGIPHFEYKLKK